MTRRRLHETGANFMFRPLNQGLISRTMLYFARWKVAAILGVIALAVAALDFTIGTKHVITAGIIALTVSVYSFARAAALRASTTKRGRP